MADTEYNNLNWIKPHTFIGERINGMYLYMSRYMVFLFCMNKSILVSSSWEGLVLYHCYFLTFLEKRFLNERGFIGLDLDADDLDDNDDTCKGTTVLSWA